MGTTYNITYQGESPENIKPQVDSLLFVFNQSVSTYIHDSNISVFNRSKDSINLSKYEDPFFLPILKLSKKIHSITFGKFDPTIMPLVNLYGFGYEKKDKSQMPSKVRIDSVLEIVDFDLIDFSEDPSAFTIRKHKERVELDFSSIAKGYGVDLVASLLEENGISNLMVEIGGEVYARGVNPTGRSWTLGINRPDPSAGINDIILPINIKSQGLATSGDYRNFYILNDEKYTHIIDPITGKSHASKVLSASIMAESCALADGLATACILLGVDSSLELINKLPDTEGCLITHEDGDYIVHYSNGLKEMINNEHKF